MRTWSQATVQRIMARSALAAGVLLVVPPTAGPREPGLVLWAWERPERLGFIDPERTGVAFLASTLQLEDNAVIERPRQQPLIVPPGTWLTTVVRIESRRGSRFSGSDVQRIEAARLILDVARRMGSNRLQIDFDARRSERAFFRALLLDLRHQLPSGTGLSITALASWCLEDDWIADLPIDEAVPMLFSMGPEAAGLRRRLDAGGDFSTPLCRSSVGVSTAEPWVPRLLGRRVWVFCPDGWSRSRVAELLRPGVGGRP